MSDTSVSADLPGLSSIQSHVLKRISLKGSLTKEDSISGDLLKSKALNYSEFAKEEIFAKSKIKSILKEISSQISPNYIDFLTIGTLLDLVVETVTNLQQKIFECMRLNTQEASLLPEIPMDECSCQSCCELLYNPTTLLCGHTFCNYCLNGAENLVESCIVCNKPIHKEKLHLYRGNVTLSSILQKWHPTEWLSRSFTVEGLTHFKKMEYRKAFDKFNKSICLSPQSHVAYLHRAKANYFMGEFDEAYQDAWAAAYLARTWPEVHLVLGEICFTQHYLEEALLSFSICLSYDQTNSKAKQRLKEVLSALISHESFPEDANSKSVHSRKRTHDDEFGLNINSKKLCSSNSSCLPKEKLYFGQTNMKEGLVCTSKCPKEYICNDIMCKCSLYVHPNISFEYDGDQSKQRTELQELDNHIKDKLKSSLLSIASSLTEAFFANASTSNREQASSLLKIQSPSNRKVKSELLDESDFECSLCMRIFYDPVCTPCGHVFCQFCIERCLDHNAVCPLCKQSMKVYLAETLENIHPPCDYVTKALIKHHLPEEYKERENLHHQEIDELMQSKPVFVCTIAFPSVPCPLHIFEPRYRLMLRRCLDYNQREFGMCMPADKKPHHPIGTLLKVRDVKFFPDGRSVVDSIGYRRFRTSHCEVKDGYNVAKYTYIVDQKVLDPASLQDLLNLADKVYTAARNWFAALSSTVSGRITQHFGQFPSQDENVNTENGPDWLWWVLAVLPVEERVQATILGKNILRERLLIIHRILVCLKQKKK